MKKLFTLNFLLVFLSVYSQLPQNQWVWVGGSNEVNDTIGEYGLIGVEDPINWPDSRIGAVGITSDNGELLVFGGITTEGTLGANQIWSYNIETNNWTYKKGRLTNGYTSYYHGGMYNKEMGIEHWRNNPPYVINPQAWKDNEGNMWIFGGGWNSWQSVPEFNAMWKYIPDTNNWIKISEGNTENDGNFGIKGIESESNIPPYLVHSITWTDLEGNLWLFGGEKLSNNSLKKVSGEDCYSALWKYDISTKKWTWVAGPKEKSILGVYDILGEESPLNQPGARAGGISWVDEEGFLCLFGGFGPFTLDPDGNPLSLKGYNDIWKFNINTNQWIWVKGSETTNENIVTTGTEHEDNLPRGTSSERPSSWKDLDGNVWYYQTPNDFNTSTTKLWKYNPQTNNWMLAKSMTSFLPVYGTMGEFDINNTPFNRASSVSWTSDDGYLYLFSGSYSIFGNGYFDIWKYDIETNMWMFVNGFKNDELPTDGIPSYQRHKLIGDVNEEIHPGYSEDYSAKWTDSEGNMWVYGIKGTNYGGISTSDLWKYNSQTNQWQWINGNFDYPIISYYGTMGVENYENKPLKRKKSMAWTDNNDNLWLFGGTINQYKNDLWKYNVNTNNWVWINGSNNTNQVGNYGEKGVMAPTNVPGARENGVTWVDESNNLWLFGGRGYGSTTSGYLNDLWKYNISSGQWTWMKGSNQPNQNEFSAGIGISHSDNTPGKTKNAYSWKDLEGNFWLFNDGAVWKFDGANWIKIKIDQDYDFGEIGVYEDENSPGKDIENAACWSDQDGSLLLFSGNKDNSYTNLLWRFDISLNNWARLNANMPLSGNYGQIFENFISNKPGARERAVFWKDNENNIFLYGGLGYDENNLGKLSDVWKSNRNYYIIQGKTTFDTNNNGCVNSNVNVPNVKITVNDSSLDKFTFSNEEGNYLEITGDNQINLNASLNYFTFTPISETVNYDYFGEIKNIDFCASATTDFNDLEVVLIPLTQAIPGFDAQYKVHFKNVGTTNLSGTVSFSYSEELADFISASPTVQTQSDGNLIWEFSDLAPFESRDAWVTLGINSPSDTPPVNSDDVLNFHASIEPIVNDEAPENNTFELNQVVINSYDPNDKNCLEGTIVGEEYIGEYVHYIIRFENTGTADATHVIVKDFIDPQKFDINTIQPIDSSHEFRFSISEENTVAFNFENINLPGFPSEERYGYCVFKIKTKETLDIGDTFTNSANIYFDYNSPIQTDEYTTLIDGIMNSEDSEYIVSKLKIYPNPVKDILNIKSDSKIKSIELFDVSGRLIKVNIVKDFEIIQDLSSQPKGTYVLRIYTEKGVSSHKIIKQ